MKETETKSQFNYSKKFKKTRKVHTKQKKQKKSSSKSGDQSMNNWSAYRLKWEEESAVKFLTGIKSGLLKASERHLSLRKEYKLWNTILKTGSNKLKIHVLTWNAFRRSKRISPTSITWMKPYLSHFCTYCFGLFKKTIVNKWKITLCNSSKTLVLWTFWLNTCTAAFSHLIKLREKD